MTAAQPALAPAPAAATTSQASNARPRLAGNAAHQPRSQSLERLGQAVQRRAESHGLEAEFLGVEPLFDTPRLYGEGHSPWVICPAARDPLVSAGIPIPARQRRQLGALVSAGMDFPHLYFAHEVAATAGRAGVKNFDTMRELTDAETKRLVVRPEAPATTRRTAERLENAARTVGTGLLTAGAAAAIGAGALLAAPIAVLALAADGLDPAVIGVLTLPDAGHKPGTPAAWFLLARWDW